MPKYRNILPSTISHHAVVCVAVCTLVGSGGTPQSHADPPPGPSVVDAGDTTAPTGSGAVPSGPPGVANTPDGRTLTVAATDETQLPVSPLTTALSARDWLVGGTITGTVTGSVNGGTLETGYQIGCQAEMDKIFAPSGTVGVGTSGSSFDPGASNPIAGLVPTGVTFPIQGAIQVQARPGAVVTVPVDKKVFKGTTTRITLKDLHIKIDNCVGGSSLRSYATLTSSGTDADDIVSYYGITKVF